MKTETQPSSWDLGTLRVHTIDGIRGSISRFWATKCVLSWKWSVGARLTWSWLLFSSLLFPTVLTLHKRKVLLSHLELWFVTKGRDDLRMYYAQGRVSWDPGKKCQKGQSLISSPEQIPSNTPGAVRCEFSFLVCPSLGNELSIVLSLSVIYLWQIISWCYIH